MYHDDNSDVAETEYQVFITKEDFEKSTPFATIKANMNPEILMYPDEEHEGLGFLQYDLVESDRVDTPGCGDSYHAGFVCSHMMNEDIYEAMRIGTEFATETLSHFGGF